LSTGTLEERNFPHLHYDFLQPGNIRDAQKRRPDDPEYDPKTLFVPESFLSKQTPVS
jgi:DNA mismatch repair protein MSH6